MEGLDNDDTLDILTHNSEARLKMNDIGTVLAFRLDKYIDRTSSHYCREFIALKVAIVKKSTGISNSFELEVHQLNDENESIDEILPSKSIIKIYH